MVWIASVLVGSPMLFVQQLEVGVGDNSRAFSSPLRGRDRAAEITDLEK